jgi:hypothetical protein
MVGKVIFLSFFFLVYRLDFFLHDIQHVDTVEYGVVFPVPLAASEFDGS